MSERDIQDTDMAQGPLGRRAVRAALAMCAGCVVIAVALSACGNSAAQREPVLVMAAASLTDVFAEVEAAFEAEHPDFDVELNLAGSASLREQILQGAPADVFASANMQTMQAVVDAGETAAAPTIFATNTLQIAVPAGNPGGVTGLQDLSDADLLIGLCAPGVPCGEFARQVLQQAGVEPSIDTNEPDVRALLTKIAADELDAGIVYATDVRSTRNVEGIGIDPSISAAITYPIVELRQSASGIGAAAFVDFVHSVAGQSILISYGFGTP